MTKGKQLSTPKTKKASLYIRMEPIIIAVLCICQFYVAIATARPMYKYLVIPQKEVMVVKGFPDYCDNNFTATFREVHEVAISKKGSVQWNQRMQNAFQIFYRMGNCLGYMFSLNIDNTIYTRKFQMTALFTASLATLFAPVGVSLSFYALLVLRTVYGFCLSMFVAASHTIMSRWVIRGYYHTKLTVFLMVFDADPLLHRFLLNKVIRPSVTKWAHVYYIVGAVGLGVCALYTLFVYAEPVIHPFISEKEKIRIQIKSKCFYVNTVPWKEIVYSRTVLAYILGVIGIEWMKNIFLFFWEAFYPLGSIYIDNYRLPSMTSGIHRGAFGVGSSIVCDVVSKKYGKNQTSIRKMTACICLTGPYALFFMLTYAQTTAFGCSVKYVSCMLNLAQGLIGLCYSSVERLHIDMAPSYAGLLYAIASMFAEFILLLCFEPIYDFSAKNTQHNNTQAAPIMLWVSLLPTIGICVVICYFTEARIQKWNRGRIVTEIFKPNERLRAYKIDSNLATRQKPNSGRDTKPP